MYFVGDLYHVMLSPNAKEFAANIINSKQTKMNYQGLKLRSITLDWTPYAKVINCNNFKDCQVEGLLIELFDIWSELYNFTHVIDMQPDKKWGTVPINGTHWSDCDGTFSGLFGSLTKGEYDVGLSSWSTDVNRRIYVDMTSGLLSNLYT